MDSPRMYVQVAGTALYETRVPGTVGWAGYALDSPKLPAEIGLSDSLKLPGSYLFAFARPPQADTDPAGLARAALEYVRRNAASNPAAEANAAVVWLQDVAPVAFGPFEQFAFRFNRNPSGPWGVVQSSLYAALGTNLTFYALPSLILSADEDAGALVLSKQLTGTSFLGLTSGGAEFGIRVQDGEMQRALVPVAGSSCGCLAFQAQVATATAFSPSGGLPPAIPYAVADRSSGTDRLLVYPVFGAAGLPATLRCTGTVDPSDPTNTRTPEAELQAGALRTGFAVADAPALPSGFRTAEGIGVSLVPLGTPAGAPTPPPGAGAVAVASASPAGAAPGSAVACFSLAGRFGLAVEGRAPGSAQELLCGLFGSERLSFAAYDPGATASDALYFLPSQAGYAPVFPFETATLQEPESGGVRPRLTPAYATAWATVLAGGGAPPEYRAEPEGSALYALQGDGTSAGAGATILLAAPPALALPQGTAHTFPLAPYGGAASVADGETLTGFESEILAATRKTRISEAAAETWSARAAARLAPPSGPAAYGTTPQGLVARIDPATGAYLDVQLAQSTGPDGAPVPFAFGAPTREVQDALQTNQLFLAAVNPAPFTGDGAVFADTVYIVTGRDPATGRNDVWKLSARVGSGATPTSYRNVMILKFCSGSLLERVTNPNRWTAPQDFSLVAGADDPGVETVAYTGLSQWLQAYVQDGIDRADGPSGAFYRGFRRIVTDPAWNGVIVLQADLSADDLPEQIRGLAAGIDFTAFTAHHFGFTASRVSADPATGRITVEGDSSIFGLIDYENPAYALNLAAGVSPDVPVPVTTSGGFDFTVLQLQSLFENARLVDFASRVQLTVDRLFGSRVTATYAGGAPMPANGVVLGGSYVDQNGTASYVFQQDRPSVFALDGNVLPAVAFDRVQFNTLGTRDGGATVDSRFLVWGAFDFAELRAADGTLLDVLSFGSPEGTPASGLGRGLAFSNLVIGMSFPQATPNARTFAVDTANLAFDLDASRARDGSLFRGFGLQLKSFVNASGGQTPADLGFLPVTSGLRLRPLDEAWFGVVYEVTLGGPGALASGAGFTSNLLLAWASGTRAGDQERAVFIGLSLPGAAPGARLFSLQGVFKVGIGSIALIRQEVAGAAGGWFYCLRLDDVGLKIFGIVKLPPSANIQFFLFGDPDDTGSLAWYAAYVARDNPGCGKKTAPAPVEAPSSTPGDEAAA